MQELTIEEKIAEIKNTDTYLDVKNAWFPHIWGNVRTTAKRTTMRK